MESSNKVLAAAIFLVKTAQELSISVSTLNTLVSNRETINSL
jgi:hypothetical protein